MLKNISERRKSILLSFTFCLIIFFSLSTVVHAKQSQNFAAAGGSNELTTINRKGFSWQQPVSWQIFRDRKVVNGFLLTTGVATDRISSLDILVELSNNPRIFGYSIDSNTAVRNETKNKTSSIKRTYYSTTGNKEIIYNITHLESGKKLYIYCSFGGRNYFTQGENLCEAIAKSVNYTSLYEGSILLDVQRHGEAYYIFQGEKYYLGRPMQAFQIMKQLSVGITEERFINGFKQINDIWKIYRVVDQELYSYVAGMFIIRPEAHGEAYYVDPAISNNQGYSAEYLGRPADALRVMSKYGGGVTSAVIDSLPEGSL